MYFSDVISWPRAALNPVWEEVAYTIAILLCGWVVARLTTVLIAGVGRRWAERTRSTLDDYLIDAVGSSAGWLVLVLAVYLAVNRYRFGLLKVVDGVLFVITVGLLTQLAVRVLEAGLKWYAERAGQRRGDQEISRQMVPLAEMVVRTLGVLTALMVVLDYFHIEVRSILVTLGVGSLAIGLALQDTLANMFGGFVLLLDHPFGVGDRIQLDTGEVGDVQEIGLRSTRILRPDGNITIVPNAALCRTRVTNLSLPDPGSGLRIEIRLAHGEDYERAKQLLIGAAEAHEGIAKRPPPRAFLTAITDSGLVIALTCRTTDFRDQLSVTDALNVRVYRGLESAGIRLSQPVTLAVPPR